MNLHRRLWLASIPALLVLPRLSWTELATRLHVSLPTLDCWLRGAAYPTAEQLESLCTLAKKPYLPFLECLVRAQPWPSPPVVSSAWLDAVQEEAVTAIESAGILHEEGPQRLQDSLATHRIAFRSWWFLLCGVSVIGVVVSLASIRPRRGSLLS